MASRSGIKAGQAFVELRLIDQASVQMKAIAGQMSKLSSSFARTGRALFTTGAAGIGLLVKPLIDAANAAERLNAMNVVFKSDAEGMIARLSELARKTSTYKGEMFEAGTAIGAMLKGYGIAGDQMIEMTTNLVQGARDLGSVRNKSFAEMSERFLSAMAGSAVIVDQFGINLRQAAISQELLEQGLSVTAATASESQKILARYAIIMKTLSKLGYLGDAERTSKSLANAWRGLMADVKEVSTTIGSVILPAAELIVGHLRDAAAHAINWVKNNAGLIVGYTKAMILLMGIGGAMIGISVALKTAVFSLTAFNMVLQGTLATVAALKATMATVALSPVLLPAVLALGAAAYALRAQYSALFKWMGDTWGSTIKYMAQAITKGELMLGLKLLVATVKATFTAMWNFLRDGGDEFSASMATIWHGVGLIFAKVAYKIQAVWATVVEAMTKLVLFAAQVFDALTQGIGSESDKNTAKRLRADAESMVERATNKRIQAGAKADKASEDLLKNARKSEDYINSIFAERKKLRDEALQEQEAAIAELKAEIESVPAFDPGKLNLPGMGDFKALMDNLGGQTGAGSSGGTGPGSVDALQKGTIEAAKQARTNADRQAEIAREQRDELIDESKSQTAALEEFIASFGAV